MKRSLLTLAILLLAMAAQAQFKIQQNGQVSLNTMSNSLTQGVQFTPTCTHFNSTSNTAWSAVTLSRPKHKDAKSWIVVNPNTSHHTFFVTGAGVVYYTQMVQTSRTNDSKSDGETLNGIEALNIIRQLKGYSYRPLDVEIPDFSGNEFVSKEAIEGITQNYKRNSIGLNGLEIESVFPDAVRTNPEGNKCIDYNAVVVVLLEAVKEQQRQIDELNSILEKK